MLSSSEIKQEFLQNYRYAHDYWAPFMQDTKVYTLAGSGYTWSEDERQKLLKDGREPLELNIMRRPLQFYSGYLRDNIKNVVISPVEGSDQLTADQLNKVSTDIWNRAYGYPIFLDACDETFKSGISLCGLRIDYSKDFINGDLVFYKRTYNSFYLDPTFENIDLSDCGFCIMRDLVGKSQAKSLLPDVDPNFIDELMGYRDDKFLNYQPQFTTFARNKNLLAYDQYYRRTTRMRKMLVDMRTGFYRDISEVDKEEIDKLEKGIYRFNRMRSEADILGINENDIPQIEIRDVERPYIELNVMLNGEQVYIGEDKTKITEAFPFVPLLCYFEPSIWMPSQRIQGIAATQWSMQRQFNKRHMKIVDMMDSEISTGFKYILGTVPDPEEMQQSGQNKLIGVDPEDNPYGLGAVEQLRGGGANPALIQYQEILDNLSLTLANVTESIMGIDEGGNTQVSGRLAQVRIAQGLRSSRKVFDNIELAQEILAKLVMQGIQLNYPPAKIKRMINEDPTEQFYDSNFEQYDAVIKEGVRSKTQKDAYYYELVNLKRDGIVDVPQSEIVRALQMAGLSDLEKAITAKEEAQQAQQQKVDEQERLAMELANSQKESNLSMSAERRARVVSDLALSKERISEAEQNRSQAALDRAKTIAEIQDLDTNRLMKALEFVNMLEAQEIADREAINEKVKIQAESIKQDISDEQVQVIPSNPVA